MGKNHAKEFRQHIENMNNEFKDEKDINKKSEKLSQNLESLKSWAEKSQASANRYTLTKIASMIGNSILAVKSALTRDGKFSEYRSNISQTMSDLTNRKILSRTRENVLHKAGESKSHVEHLNKRRKLDSTQIQK